MPQPANPSQKVLNFYAAPSAMTDFGPHTRIVQDLPNDVAELVRVVQGLALHEYMADAYGVTIPEARKEESHIRAVREMVDRILVLDGDPLTIARPPDKRLVGVCQHFSSLMVAMLRAKGVPARARYGFGSYFNPGYYEEHTVAEYWNAGDKRWLLVDPQFDDVWQTKLQIKHDVLDVPRDRYLVAGKAWTQCRRDDADASRFGIFVGEMRGFWMLAGELLRDLAALNKVEMLPWDTWGTMPKPNEPLSAEELSAFDKVAALIRSPDESFDQLRKAYENDELRVPATVFNAMRQRPEPVGIGA